MPFDLYAKTIGPYYGISEDETREGRRFRIVLYGAYNAFGLIGPENNGILVLDNDRMQVLLDQECKQSSGYFGPSTRQTARFLHILHMSDTAFAQFVNTHPRARYRIQLEVQDGQ